MRYIFKKKIFFFSVILLGLNFLFLNKAKAQTIDSTYLKSIENDILKVDTIQGGTFDFKTHSILNPIEQKRVYYITNTEVPTEPNEILSLRTASSKTFDNKDGTYTTRQYFNDPFVKVLDNWYVMDNVKVDSSVYNSTITKPITLWLNSAYADTVFTAVSGGLYKNVGGGDTWANLRAAANADGLRDDLFLYVYHPNAGDSYQWLTRGAYIFQLDLTDKQILTASLNLVCSAKDNNAGLTAGNMDLEIVSFSSTSTSALAVSDWSLFGDTSLGSMPFASVDVGDSTYNKVYLNATGTSTLQTGYNYLGTKIGGDLVDTDPGASAVSDSRIICHYSDYTGTDKDPVFEYTYVNTGTSTTETTTTTPLQLGSGEAVNNIAIITAWTASTTAGYITYYHIPAIPIFLILIIVLFLADRVIIEFIIRWREQKKL